jgi:hypothetical protein
MTTDVHQQRQEPRPFKGRRCLSCGVRLYEGECARLVDGKWERVDVCLLCETNGPPRRPQGAPAPGSVPAEV